MAPSTTKATKKSPIKPAFPAPRFSSQPKDRTLPTSPTRSNSANLPAIPGQLPSSPPIILETKPTQKLEPESDPMPVYPVLPSSELRSLPPEDTAYSKVTAILSEEPFMPNDMLIHKNIEGFPEPVSAVDLLQHNDTGGTQVHTQAWNAMLSLTEEGRAVYFDLTHYHVAGFDDVEGPLTLTSQQFIELSRKNPQFMQDLLLRIIKLGYNREVDCKRFFKLINMKDMKIKELEHRHKQARDSNANLSEDKDVLQNKVSSYQRQLQALQADHNDLLNKINPNQDRLTDLETLLEQTCAERDNLEGLVKELTRQVADLQTEGASHPRPPPAINTTTPEVERFYRDENGSIRIRKAQQDPHLMNPESHTRLRTPPSVTPGLINLEAKGVSATHQPTPTNPYMTYNTTAPNVSQPQVYKSERDDTKIFNWITQAQDYVASRTDRTPDAMARYLITRTEGVAHVKLQNLLRQGCLPDPEAVYQVVQSFKEPFEVERATIQYGQLMMKDNQGFEDFFAEFDKLVARTSWPENVAIQDLYSKVTTKMRRVLDAQIPFPTTLRGLADMCRQIEVQQLRSEQVGDPFRAPATDAKPIGGVDYEELTWEDEDSAPPSDEEAAADFHATIPNAPSPAKYTL